MIETAVILAAGRARRLGGQVPKGLLSIGGEPLLVRLCRQLLDRGLEVVVVTGHRAEEIEAVVARSGVRFVRNPIYAESELGWSCGVGLAEVAGQGALVVLGDNVTDGALFDRVLESGGELTLAWLDVALDEESMKLQVEGDRPVLMGKGLPLTATGEFAGVLAARGRGLTALREAIARFDPRMDLCHGPLNSLLEGPLDCRAVDCSGMRWIEIDFPHDVTRMRRIFDLE